MDVDILPRLERQGRITMAFREPLTNRRLWPEDQVAAIERLLRPHTRIENEKLIAMALRRKAPARTL